MVSFSHVQISLVMSCTAVCREISLTVIIPLPLCSKIETITNIFIFLWFEASTATEKICPFKPSSYLCSQLKEEQIYFWQYTTLLSYHGKWLLLSLKFGEEHKFAVTINGSYEAEWILQPPPCCSFQNAQLCAFFLTENEDFSPALGYRDS